MKIKIWLKGIAFILLTLTPLTQITSIVQGVTTYDFVQNASKASWSSGAGSLPFPGNPSDNKGFALNLVNIQLEDSATYTNALETHPQWVADGYIMGKYPQQTIAQNTQLRVKVGFLKGATGTDGVTFEVRLEIGQSSYLLINQQASYDTKIDSVTLSLNQYNGQAGRFILLVKAGKSSSQDWAVWAEAKIEEIPLPDLTITDISLQGSTISYKTKNIGSVNIGSLQAPASFTNILMIDGKQVASDSFFGILDAGQEVTESFNYNFQATSTQHAIRVYADWDQKITEKAESNNYLEEVWFFGKPDLYAYGITSSPSVATVNGEIHLKPQIRNVGDAASSTCLCEFRVDGAVIGSLTIPPIPAGKDLTEVNAQLSITWTPASTGQRNVSFAVDSTNVVDESDESNNNANTMIDVIPSDVDPPTVQLYCTPLKLPGQTINERDNVTFIAEASDPSGIFSITIFFNGMAKKISYNSTTCEYNAGYLPRLSTVYYAAGVYDKAGNYYLSPTQNFTVSSYYSQPLMVDIVIDPPEPTEVDTITFTATASYPYGVDKIRIYLNDFKAAEEENATSLSIVRGPWAPEYTVSYYAEAVDIDGNIKQTPEKSFTVERLVLYNTKNMSAYMDREIFVISDLDWRAVLQLVPIAVWKEMHPTEPVAVGSTYSFPALIYHEENETSFDADSTLRFIQQYAEYGRNRFGIRVTIIGDPVPELVRLMVAAPPVGAGLNETQVRVWESSEISSLPTTLLLGTSVVSEVITPVGGLGNLEEALLSKWSVDAHISLEDSTGVVPMDDILTESDERNLRNEYWSDLNVYVLCEDEYSTALMASVYASLINAPLIFKDHYDIDELEHKGVYLVGEFTDEEANQLRSHGVKILSKISLNELRRNYVIATGTNKLILVNPLDLWTSHRGVYYTDKGSPIEYLFGKHSLAAPFLAADKKEVIISIPSNSYPEIDNYVKESFETLIPGPGLKYLTIIATPEVIPNARANVPYAPSIYDDTIYYQGQRYIDTDIVMNDLEGSSERYLFTLPRMQYNPVGSDKVVAWVDEDTWGDIWYRTLPFGTDTRLTGTEGLASQYRPAVYDSRVVWQDHRGASWDIYMLDTALHTQRPIISSAYDDEYPAIWADTLVWQRNQNSYWKIMSYDLASGTERQVSPSQYYNNEKPAICGNHVVYVSQRGNSWDVYMSTLDADIQETQITNDDSIQWLPRIFGDRVVWQDNRNGNWDIYSYDIATQTETRITYEPIDQLLPNIWGDDLVWLERDENGYWYIVHYDFTAGISRRIAQTEVSADDGPLWLEVDGRYYGSTQNLGYQDIATGRIYGVTVADASSYIARDLFYDRINKNKDALVVVREDHQTELDSFTSSASLEPYARSHYWTPEIEEHFRSVYFYAGYDGVDPRSSDIYSRYDDCGLIVFVDHGIMEAFQSVMDSYYLQNNDVQLEPATVLDLACLTGAYYVMDTVGNPPYLFAAQNMRRGAMVYMGATDVSYWHNMLDNLLTGLYEEGRTIGEVYIEARNEEYDVGNWVSMNLKGDIYYALHGDPTFQPKWQAWIDEEAWYP